MEPTTLENKIAILSQLWTDYKHDEEFADFVEYNDIGLPVAYAIANNIVISTELAETFIQETFDLLLAGLGVEDDDYQDLVEVLGAAE